MCTMEANFPLKLDKHCVQCAVYMRILKLDKHCVQCAVYMRILKLDKHCVQCAVYMRIICLASLIELDKLQC